jgi:hypothetical protein
MKVAIFTANDFDKVNGVTTTFKAALQAVPAGMHLRVYTAGREPLETDSYLALRSIGMPTFAHAGTPRRGLRMGGAEPDRQACERLGTAPHDARVGTIGAEECASV